MKKKLIFCICILLSIITCISVVPFSAHSYDCKVEVTSSAAMMVNIETDTVVYEKNINTAHYMSYLSNLMTFIVACNNMSDINERFTIDQETIDRIPNSDGTLDVYIDHTLTIKDLLCFIMMTNGHDACYILADHIFDGDIDKFVELMNKKARDLGCTKTKFSSVSARNDKTQFSTCSDLYKIMKCALALPEYQELASKGTYMPEKYTNEALEVTNNNSLLKNKSPYYFKYAENGKYGADLTAKGNIAVTSVYRDVSYVCIILGAQLNSEHNAFTEAKQLLSWAYTYLGNQKIISESDVLATVTAESTWGESKINLTAGKDIIRTIPAEYENSKFSIDYDESTLVSLPIFLGQNMGTAKLLYDGKLFEEIDLISDSSQGISMVEDLGNFFASMYNSTLVPAPQAENEATVDENPTQAKG